MAATMTSRRELLICSAVFAAGAGTGFAALLRLEDPILRTLTYAGPTCYFAAASLACLYRSMAQDMRPASFSGLLLPPVAYGAAIAAGSILPALLHHLTDHGLGKASPFVSSAASAIVVGLLLTFGRLADLSIDPVRPEGADQTEERKTS